MDQFTQLQEDLKTHQLNDSMEFGKASDQRTLIQESVVAIEKKLETLATKEDVRGVVQAYKSFMLAEKIITGGGKWSFRALVVIATLIGALIVILGGFKTALGWIGIHFLTK